MNEEKFVCVDIGSTWTKAALFRKSDDCFIVETKDFVPTTTDNLTIGFYNVLEKMDCAREIEENNKELTVRFSSSAKGGLNVVIVGLVPELTLKIGRIAAHSAGARISATFPFKLTDDSINLLKRLNPDIILLCGGTDGGNERYVSANARIIAESDFNGTVIFAGNNMATDIISDILSEKRLLVTENLLPDLGRLNVEPVREAIRKVFLSTIVKGKGLSELIKRFDSAPVPTPLAVYRLVEAIGGCVDGWRDFAVIDLGGATTDFYSFSDSYYESSGAVLKGIKEPVLKRSVEGDLGLRISALSAIESSEAYLQDRYQMDETELEVFRSYTEKLEARTDFLPESLPERRFDSILADICIKNAFLRHAGQVERVYTTGGIIWAQTGKDLRRIKRVIGTGGYLATGISSGYYVQVPGMSYCGDDKMALLPEEFDYFIDADYIFPLLGCLASEFPSQSANTAIKSLTQSRKHESVKEYAQSEIDKNQS